MVVSYPELWFKDRLSTSLNKYVNSLYIFICRKEAIWPKILPHFLVLLFYACLKLYIWDPRYVGSRNLSYDEVVPHFQEVKGIQDSHDVPVLYYSLSLEKRLAPSLKIFQIISENFGMNYDIIKLVLTCNFE